MSETTSREEMRDRLRAYIAASLASDPDALPFAMSGIAAGMSAAVSKERERSACKDRAMLAAFALLKPDRLTLGVKDLLGEIIVQGCSRSAASKVETEMLDRFDPPTPPQQTGGPT